MSEYLKLRLEPAETEVYAPAADAYINIREDGTITIKKASGQEVFNCKFWDIEADKIHKHKAAAQFLAKFLAFFT